MSSLKEILAQIPYHLKRETDLRMSISVSISESMDRQGLSSVDLALKTGVHHSDIVNILSADTNLDLRTIATIEEALGHEIISV